MRTESETGAGGVGVLAGNVGGGGGDEIEVVVRVVEGVSRAEDDKLAVASTLNVKMATMVDIHHIQKSGIFRLGSTGTGEEEAAMVVASFFFFCFLALRCARLSVSHCYPQPYP